jgi:hypothetical protein
MHGLDHTNFLGKFFSGGEVPRFRLGGDFFFWGGGPPAVPPCGHVWPGPIQVSSFGCLKKKLVSPILYTRGSSTPPISAT